MRSGGKVFMQDLETIWFLCTKYGPIQDQNQIMEKWNHFSKHGVKGATIPTLALLTSLFEENGAEGLFKIWGVRVKRYCVF